MNNINTILDLLITNSGLSGSEIARKINVSYTTLNSIQNGKTTNPTIENATKIADFFGISVDQLIGKAPMNNFFEKNLACIPLVNLHEINIDATETLTTDNYSSWQRIEVNDELKEHNLFAIKVSGDAMSPMFDEKTIAIIDKNLEIKNKSIVLAYLTCENDYVIRKLSIDGIHRILKPINNDFPIIHLKGEDKILGVVVSARKDF